jgi:hypothetical protein
MKSGGVQIDNRLDANITSSHGHKPMRHSLNRVLSNFADAEVVCVDGAANMHQRDTPTHQRFN